jgi:hypothetical protein
MILSQDEKTTIINALEDYADRNELWELPQDVYGKYYSENNDSSYDKKFMAKQANIIKKILDKLC